MTPEERIEAAARALARGYEWTRIFPPDLEVVEAALDASGYPSRCTELETALYGVAVSRHNMTHDEPFDDCSIESCAFVRDVLAGVPSAPEGT